MQEAWESWAQFYYAQISYWFLLGRYYASIKPFYRSWYQAGAHPPWFRTLMRIVVINPNRLPQILSQVCLPQSDRESWTWKRHSAWAEKQHRSHRSSLFSWGNAAPRWMRWGWEVSTRFLRVSSRIRAKTQVFWPLVKVLSTALTHTPPFRSLATAEEEGVKEFDC